MRSCDSGLDTNGRAELYVSSSLVEKKKSSLNNKGNHGTSILSLTWAPSHDGDFNFLSRGILQGQAFQKKGHWGLTAKAAPSSFPCWEGWLIPRNPMRPQRQPPAEGKFSLDIPIGVEPGDWGFVSQDAQHSSMWALDSIAWEVLFETSF